MLFDFIIIRKFLFQKLNQNFLPSFLIQLNDDWIFFSSKEIFVIKSGRYNYIIIGDCINKQDIRPENIDISKLKGNFYLISWIDNRINIWSSMFNILPVYYTDDFNAISNNIQRLFNIVSDKTIDKTFILENLLFNYGFFNRTIIKEIKLLNSNSYFEINNSGCIIKKHINIGEFFSSTIISIKKSKKYLSDLFIETILEYFPEEDYSISFTSGLDGRTIVSCSTYYNMNFFTGSFGKIGNSDVEIPRKNALSLKIPYHFFPLDENYSKYQYPVYADLIIKDLPGYNGLLYPHFKAFSRENSQNYNYLLSGFFGSELFRAMHITGAVTSASLVNLFNTNAKDFNRVIWESPVLNLLNIDEFKDEIDLLSNDLIDYFNKIPEHLTKNQKFYFFVFEEILRKFFGSQIYFQMQDITIRTPFIDFNFIKEILKTEFAGANNDFYTENVLKRFKGQLLYSEIIRKTNKSIYKQKTGKGYPPSALIEPFGVIAILYPYLRKKISRKINPQNLDNLGIISGFKYYCENNQSIINRDLFSHKVEEKIKHFFSNMSEKERDLILHITSISRSIDYIINSKFNEKN
jgi:asparagine synthase (glutamine-hydrolysing)